MSQVNGIGHRPVGLVTGQRGRSVGLVWSAADRVTALLSSAVSRHGENRHGGRAWTRRRSDGGFLLFFSLLLIEMY